jgi:hypothetical protein
MNEELPENSFRPGGRYKNRKGFFTVISLDGDKMRIRWDSGEEITDTIASQAQILRNMRREIDATTSRSNCSTKPAPPPSTIGSLLAAVLNPNADFTSPNARECTRCQRNLAQHPVVMIGQQAFCYRCAKLVYPALMDEVRRARNREARRTAAARREYRQMQRAAFGRSVPKPSSIAEPVVTLHPDCWAPEFKAKGYDRKQILHRDHFTCQSCGRRFPPTQLEVHHLLPKTQKGSDSFRNLITLCKECHFHEDWFDHVHKDNLRRISAKRFEMHKLKRWF